MERGTKENGQIWQEMMSWRSLTLSISEFHSGGGWASWLIVQSQQTAVSRDYI